VAEQRERVDVRRSLAWGPRVTALEMVAVALGGGALRHAFGWLRDRKGSELTEQEQYRAAIREQFERYERALKEQSHEPRAELEAAREALQEQTRLTLSVTAELERERSRRIEAERERDQALYAARGASQTVDELRAVVDGAVQRIAELERERNDAHRELARRADDEAREAVSAVK
jgi:predicted dinucleotide-utilizing enzyme